MSVELVNDSVVLPHWINWRDGMSYQRRWRTEVAAGVTAAEDRATGAPGSPLRRIQFTANCFTVPERARLVARILAALKSGRAVCPFFGRAQYIKAYAPLVTTESQTVGNTYEVQPLEIGKLYYYEKGPYDLQLSNTVNLVLTQNGYFRALSTLALIQVSSVVGVTGTIRRVQFFDFVDTDGLWPWAAGQYAFFLRPRPPEGGRGVSEPSSENTVWLLNAGGSDSGDWTSDAVFASGGAGAGTGSAIDTTLVPQPAPQLTYQTARNLSGTDPNAQVTFTISGLCLSVPCRLRLHFAEIVGGFDGSAARRRFDLCVLGEQAQWFKDVEPYRMAGNALNKASFIDVLSALPAFDGTLQVILKPKALDVVAASIANVNLAAAVFSLDGVIVQLGELVLIKNQTTAAENGIYAKQFDGTLARADVADSGTEIAELPAVHVIGGTVNAGTYWRCTTAAPITLGTTAINFATTTTPYNAGINAIEFYQCTWDVVPLISGTTNGHVKFDGFLRGVYDPETQVFPAFFGKLSIEDARALTDVMAELSITLEEPLGSGAVAVPGTCPADACYLDGPFPFPDQPPGPPLLNPPPLGCPGESEWTWFSEPPNGGLSLMMGVAGSSLDDPATKCHTGVLTWWAQKVWADWQQYKRDNPAFHSSGYRLIWSYYHPPSPVAKWDANRAFDGDYPPTGVVGLDWSITVNYCPAP